MIDVRNVHRRFGQIHAVRGVSFTVHKGEAIGLLGPNGAGKTTTIRMITGALPPTSGQVRIDGFDTLGQAMQARRRIGYLPETTPVYPEMRVTEFLRYRAVLQGVPRRDRRSAVDCVVEQCWLRDVQQRRVGDLSKGYKQRVGLAAALLHDPPVLVLDEPTSGLDPAQIAQTRRLFRSLAKGRALILSSHILGEVERTCDRVVVIMGGEVKLTGNVAELARGDSLRCVLEVKTNDSAVLRSALSATPGLRAINAEPVVNDPAWMHAVIETTGDGDVRERVAVAMRDAQLLVRELRTVERSLEDRFMQLIEEPAATSDNISSDEKTVAPA